MKVNMTACAKCGSNIGWIEKTAMHNKLTCNKCKTYVKFIPTKELSLYEEIPDNRHLNQQSKIYALCKEIKFKIDLILDHFDIGEEIE